MGNSTNDKNWAANERLRFIEQCAWWRGSINRRDLVLVFDVSLAQASSDIQRYADMNPTALIYDLRKKRYFGSPTMKCMLGDPNIHVAARTWLGENSPAKAVEHADIAHVMDILPERKVTDRLQRRVFMALVAGQCLKIKYESMSDNGSRWRVIHPRKLVNSGHRMHVRAWCEEREAWLDFNISRIREADWPTNSTTVLPEDTEWDEFVTIKVQAKGNLTSEQKAVVESDFGMKDGRLNIKVRKALEIYVRNHLGLPTKSEEVFPVLEEI